MHPLLGLSVMVALLLAITTPVKAGSKRDKDGPPDPRRGGPGGVSINIYQGVTPPGGGARPRDEVVVKRHDGEGKV